MYVSSSFKNVVKVSILLPPPGQDMIRPCLERSMLRTSLVRRVCAYINPYV